MEVQSDDKTQWAYDAYDVRDTALIHHRNCGRNASGTERERKRFHSGIRTPSSNDDSCRAGTSRRRKAAGHRSWQSSRYQDALGDQPEDAVHHGVGNGQQVRVTSRTGSVAATVEVHSEIMPGVI